MEDNPPSSSTKSPAGDDGFGRESLGGTSEKTGSVSDKVEKKKTVSSEGATKKITSFKRRIWMFQSVVIAFVIAMCVTQLVIAVAFFNDSKKDAATVASDILQEVYALQGSIILSLTESREVFEQFLLGTDHTREQIEYMFKSEAEPLFMEIDTLVDVDMKIVASAYDKRYGQVYDPNGHVSEMIASFPNGKQSDESILQRIRVEYFTREELEAVNGPIYLTTDADGYGNRYSIKNDDKVLIAYALGAIVSEVDGNSLVGVKIVGYILNGKHKFIRDALAAIGKDTFGGFFHYDNNQWDIGAFILAQGLSESRTYTDYHDDGNQITTVLNTQEVNFDTHDIDGQHYTIVLSPLPQGVSVTESAGTVEDSTSPAVLVMGKSNAQIDASLEATTIAIASFLCGTVLIILTNAILSDMYFLQPIHQLVIAVEKKDQTKMTNALERLRKMKFGFYIVVGGIFSIAALMGAMLLYNYYSVTGNFEAQSSAWSKLRMFELFYRRRAAENYADARGFAVNPEFRLLFDSSSNSSMSQRLSDVTIDLDQWCTDNEIEFAFIVNASKNVIASATELPSNTFTFDPNGIVTRVLKAGTAIRANVLLENSVYVAVHPKRFTDSTLRATVTGKMAAIQLIAFPISGPSSSSTDGVLIVGSTLNGNPRDITVRAVNYFGESCSGIFYVKNNEATLVASVIKKKNSELATDVDVANADVKSLVLSAAEHGEYKHSSSMNILGEEWEVTAEQVFPGSEFDTDGHEHLSRTYDDTIVLVQCSSLSDWKHLLVTIKSISSVTFVLNVIACAVLSYLTFKPIYEFGQRYERKWEAKSASRGNKLTLANVIPRIVGRSERGGSTQASSVMQH